MKNSIKPILLLITTLLFSLPTLKALDTELLKELQDHLPLLCTEGSPQESQERFFEFMKLCMGKKSTKKSILATSPKTIHLRDHSGLFYKCFLLASHEGLLTQEILNETYQKQKEKKSESHFFENVILYLTGKHAIWAQQLSLPPKTTLQNTSLIAQTRQHESLKNVANIFRENDNDPVRNIKAEITPILDSLFKNFKIPKDLQEFIPQIITEIKKSKAAPKIFALFDATTNSYINPTSPPISPDKILPDRKNLTELKVHFLSFIFLGYFVPKEPAKLKGFLTHVNSYINNLMENKNPTDENIDALLDSILPKKQQPN